ncbi:MAG TPA: hypothetical protein VK879_13375 [Candidatus Sulfomarinibacteraceae bacterium]|nr:hypothetical protein [Candidatus Sulfomarinibacteraceae bacterium]
MRIHRHRIWIIVGVLAAALVAAGLVGVLPTYSQPGEQGQVDARGAASAVGEAISYQGFLTDDDGKRLSGNYAMIFRLYSQSSGGAPVYESGTMNVAVDAGLFEVGFDAPQGVFDGGPLWLGIEVEGEVLSPRQEIRPAPYAMSVRPGAVVRNAATGTALRLESQDVALYGEGGNFGVYGFNESSANGAGYGGYFTSTTGVGAFGGSTAAPSTTNPLVPGLHGHSEHGAGVYGTSDALFGYGVFGDMSGSGVGAYGRAATGYGVLGVSDGIGVFGAGESHAVYGSNTASVSGAGYGGYFESSTGVGVFGGSTAVPSMTNALPAGVYGYSENGTGIFGASGDFAWAGYFDGHVRIDGSLVISDSLFANDKSGYVVDVALHDGDEPLQQGDVVVVTGVAEPVVGEIPAPLVRKADEAASSGVIGVVDRRYDVDDPVRSQSEEGPIAPGEYVRIVTLGAFKAIRVDASYGAIAPGDLLVSSPTPGHAMRADDPAAGTVVGKALDVLEEGQGVIAVMVTLD